jgi:hypothetical protein
MTVDFNSDDCFGNSWHNFPFPTFLNFKSPGAWERCSALLTYALRVEQAFIALCGSDSRIAFHELNCFSGFGGFPTISWCFYGLDVFEEALRSAQGSAPAPLRILRAINAECIQDGQSQWFLRTYVSIIQGCARSWSTLRIMAPTRPTCVAEHKTGSTPGFV